MLDDEDDEVLSGKDTTHLDMGEESASDNEEENDGDSESESQSDEESEDEGNEEERVARMRDRLEALDASSKPTQPSTPQQPGVLTVDDLLADLDPASKAKYASALKTRKKSTRPTTLTAPLPKRQQDRLNREVASQKAKEQLDRWRDTVIQNRRAEFLSFPLRDPTRTEPVGKDKFVAGGEEEPQNELEENIRKIMVESGLAAQSGKEDDNGEAALLKTEELATNNLPVEDVLRRRAELRRSRELLFREEIKAKRIAKIKSKAYRRVHRKQKQRERELIGELRDGEDAEEEKEKADRKRAEARMGAKHKDSKFAKSIRQTDRSVWDGDAREAVLEDARRKEELRKRIEGEDVESNGEGSDGSVDSEDDEDAGTSKQLRHLQQDGGEVEGRGLQGMKFMRAANERHRAQNDEDIKRLRKELAVEDGDEEEEESGIEDQGLGRAIFGPKGKEKAEVSKKAKRPEMDEGDVSGDDDGEDGEQDVAIVIEKTTPPKGIGEIAAAKKATTASGPLAKSVRPDTRDSAPNNEKGKEAEGSSWLTGPTKRSKKDRRRERDADGGLVLDMMTTIDTSKPNPTPKPKSAPVSAQPDTPTTEAGNTDGWTLVTYNDQADDNADSEPEETINPLLTPSQQKSAHHRRAFAVDDVLQTTFESEKTALAASEEEKETSTHLPGWGSWTGVGLSKSIRKSNARARHNPLYKTKLPGGGVKAEDRRDAKLENVIVSEKGNRKGKVYQAPMLPHGFETKGQYERSLRLPVGPEWTTKETFQRQTRPRVVVKPGQVVEAMERPLV